MGDCQNYRPLLGPYYNTGPNLGDPKKDHNFDNPPGIMCILGSVGIALQRTSPADVPVPTRRPSPTSFNEPCDEEEAVDGTCAFGLHTMIV